MRRVRPGSETLERNADVQGSIPEQYYSTSDPKSFDQFLSRSEILIASLPSTPYTVGLLTAEHLSTSKSNNVR
jgi:phosphoglycerate dehydrogenase-like enzyme